MHVRDYYNFIFNDYYIRINCDDGSRYTAATNINDLQENCQHYIDRAGDLSLVVKLGRKSSKCQVNIHNKPQHATIPTLQASHGTLNANAR